MNEQILAVLKRKLDDIAVYGNIDAETRRNILKEELQFYVLNFIYHHPEYATWIMYGGSALRIIHELDRMSIDLDFEVTHEITEKFLDILKEEVERHFSGTYGIDSNFLTVKIMTGRGLLLKFNVGEELSFGHPSKQVHVKIDLNHFVAPKIVTERRIINRSQFSFVIVVYNMSALMASKIAAIFLREQRGVGKNVYDYKGRDIYDLLWYMGKKIVPDFDYLDAKLKEKKIELLGIKKLFDKLTREILNYAKMDDLLKEDLLHLFENPFQFEDWFKNWRESYLQLLDDYRINTITSLKSWSAYQDFSTDNFSFVYWYSTEDKGLVRIAYIMSDYWIMFRDGDLPTTINDRIIELVSGDITLNDKMKQYATLFYEKTEAYFKKTNRIMLGDSIVTKAIRMTTDNLNQKEQIVLNRSALLSCELDDLLK